MEESVNSVWSKVDESFYLLKMVPSVNPFRCIKLFLPVFELSRSAINIHSVQTYNYGESASLPAEIWATETQFDQSCTSSKLTSYFHLELIVNLILYL